MKKLESSNILIILFFLIISTKEDIINNPIQVSEHPNPVILYTQTQYYIYTSGESIIINKENGKIESRNDFCTYTKPYVLCNDESNNFFIYSQSRLYQITGSSSYYEITLPSITFPNNQNFIGYIKESEYSGPTTLESDLKGHKCKIEKNEIIIYGKNDLNYIMFSFINREYSGKFEVPSETEDHISCSSLDNSEYICASVSNGIVYVYVLVYVTNALGDTTNCGLSLLSSVTYEILKTHTHVNMYNTVQNNLKIMCAKNKNTMIIECIYIQITIDEESSEKWNYSLQSAQYSTIILSYPSDSSSNGDCAFTTFSSETLFCCGGTNLIKCARIVGDNNLINSFSINMEGENSSLNIISFGNYVNIFFMNTLNTDEKFYQYYIYSPECVNLNFTIIMMHSINEDKEGNEESINNYFKRVTNTEYSIEFENIPDEYGNLTLNDELVTENKTIINEDESNIIDFISTNDKSINYYELLYTISIEETYSIQCKINLTILPCYSSCAQCTKDNSLSNSEEHNCIPNNCKEGYYIDPTKNTNCFMIDEKKSNWYFDYVEMKFDFCEETCLTCDGGTNKDCLTCYSKEEKPEHSYLYNKECIDSCPEGTYKVLKTVGYYECAPCYINCKSCNEKGNSVNMKCESCKENNIYYSKNCYKEYDSKIKSFYKPESTEITNCFELINYYIEENTYECVSKIPDYGYFLSNSVTGLFSPCHSDCKTCSKNYTENNSNCDICNNQDYNYLDGNCLETCPDGYYSFESTSSNNKKTCKKCYEKCLTCHVGAIINSNKVENMNCLTCKKEADPNDSNNLIEKYIQVEGNCFPIIKYNNEKITFNASDTDSEKMEKTCLDYGKSIIYGEYQCNTRPSNTFYVLNNEENTGVVEKCDEACNSCNGKKDTINDDTNCIECSEGYYKTEDSNTNCILESLIPDNYYKKKEDNIYYHCYIKCKKCSDYLNVETNNMNCDECIDDYYFLYETNNCYNMDFIENNEYYFSSEDNKFHKCYFTCEKCLVGGTDDNHNCIKCIDNYYYEENTNNCYNITYIENGYYLDNFTINEGELPLFKKCYDNCQTCNNKMIENEMNCILCKDNYYKINGTNNCYNEDLLNDGYFLEDNLFYPCEENCLTCSYKKTIMTGGIESNNCLSCDKTNKGLYLVDKLNNCKPIEFKVNGYYLEEDSNGIEIFYKCYDTCLLCDKGKEFDSKTNQDKHNCLSCKQNYYRLKHDLNPSNCYGNEMIDKGYMLIRNYWQDCHENCETCTDKPSYNEYRELISQNCIICYGDLHFIFQTSDCYDDSILENGYYFDDSDSMYHKCDIQCKTCEKYSTESEPKCLSCNIDQGYYPAVKKPNSRCYNKTTIDPEYINIQIYDEENGKISRIWIICYETCKTCSIYGNEEEHNCLTCISKHYLIYNTTNCVNKEFALANNYYFNKTFGQYVKCDKACNTCVGGLIGDNTNCIKCNEEEGYYPIEGNSNSLCYNSETITQGYFLNKFEMPYKWSECYEYCATCEYKGTSNKMSCLTCKTNLMNPISKKIIYLKINNGNCIKSCPDNLFLTKVDECVEICPNGTYQFSENMSCIDSCPSNYELDKDKTKCELTVINENISKEEFKEIIFKNLSHFVDENTVINGSDFKAQVISSDDLDPIQQIKNGISGLDLGNCISILKKQYNIQKDEDLIIVEIETKEDKEKTKDLDRDKDYIDLGKNVKVAIYDRSGRKLDISYCNQEITLMKIINDLEDVDLTSASEYAEYGIDVFNANDAFFNDLCHPFRSDTDIVLRDRREDLYQNVSFCGDDCIYYGINYELMTANCSCVPNNIQIEDDDDKNLADENKKGITINDLANSFTSELLSFNFIVIKCYNLVFNPLVIKNNIGFFLLLSMNALQIIFLSIFFSKCLKPIKNYMLVFEPFDPRTDPANPEPKKRQNNYNSNIVESENTNLYDILETIPDNKTNLSKKEKEIQKTIFINNLLNKNSIKKESINRSNSSKTNNKFFGINNVEENYDDALVAHYINNKYDNHYTKSLFNKNKNKIMNEEDSFMISESESQKYKNKIKNTITKKNDSNNKIFNLGYIDDDDLYSNHKISPYKSKKNTEKKILLINKNRKIDLYDNDYDNDNDDPSKFNLSKEIIVFNKNNKNFKTKKISSSTVLASINSINKENFPTSESIVTSIPIKCNKINNNSIKKVKINGPAINGRKEIIIERNEEYEDYNDNKANIKYVNDNETIFESIKIEDNNQRKINNKRMKFPKRKISNNLKSSDILIRTSNDNDFIDNVNNNINKKKRKINLKKYLFSKKTNQRYKTKENKENEIKNNKIIKFISGPRKYFSSTSVIPMNSNEDKKDEISHKSKNNKKKINLGNMRLHDKKVNYAFTDEELRITWNEF